MITSQQNEENSGYAKTQAPWQPLPYFEHQPFMFVVDGAWTGLVSLVGESGMTEILEAHPAFPNLAPVRGIDFPSLAN